MDNFEEKWFCLMVIIDCRILHPLWDLLENEHPWLDDKLMRFCQYAHGNYMRFC